MCGYSDCSAVFPAYTLGRLHTNDCLKFRTSFQTSRKKRKKTVWLKSNFLQFSELHIVQGSFYSFIHLIVKVNQANPNQSQILKHPKALNERVQSNQRSAQWVRWDFCLGLKVFIITSSYCSKGRCSYHSFPNVEVSEYMNNPKESRKMDVLEECRSVKRTI